MVARRYFMRALSAIQCCIMAVASLYCASTSSVTILHTNDMHASFLPHEATWVKSESKPLVGGFQELWRRIDSVRHVKNDVLLLDAGDVMTGNPISDFVTKDVAGGALIEMMDTIGYDAWTFGNHDLDISQKNLHGLIGLASFPTVSANVVDSTGAFPFGTSEFVIVKRGAVRIGIFGIMSTDLFHLTNTNNLRGLKVLSPTEVAQRIIDKIDPETDLIVALTHEGVEDDSVLATSTHGLDVIIGGHSHTRLTTPKVINGVIICQAGSNCENLGELDLTVGDDHVVSFNGKLIQLWTAGNGSKTPLDHIITSTKEKIDREYGQTIATLTEDWKRGRNGESALGDFIVDAMREGASADVAVANTSGIRKDLNAGPLTKLDLFELSPFRNVLVRFPIKGSGLRAFLTRYVTSVADGRGNLQISGISCTWKRSDGTVVLEQVLVDGKDLRDDATYSFGTSDFVVNQGEKYLGFTPASIEYPDKTVFQALVDKAMRTKTLSADHAARFKELR